MQQLNTDARSLKEKIIEANNEMNAFMANGIAHINPENMAELQQNLDTLENKIKTAFGEDDRLDPIIADYTAHLEKQKGLINFLESKMDENRKKVGAAQADPELGEVLENV